MSGALAGLAVDLSLFPLDTIKTRLQSEAGFLAAGGFRGVYAGIGSVAIGSAPGAALFFVTYEFSKRNLKTSQPAYGVMAASSLAEIVACLIRVPCEVVKQRAQAGNGSVPMIARKTLQTEGVGGFYRGYLSTVFREIPFSMIQFPLWEFLKVKWSVNGEVTPIKSAVCGALAGSVAAFATTPIDVAKTRIMLAESKDKAGHNSKLVPVLQHVYKTQGIRGLWAGVVPRVMWIAIGGFVFLGVYDSTKYFMLKRNPSPT